MNDLISHIGFLLHSHDCVIVPGLGGFVLNFVPAQRDGLSAFQAPASELVFNRDLVHNDGLLPESFMKVYHIGFAEANNRIHKSVNELKTALQHGETVEFGELGAFRLNEENKYIFTAKKFVRPEHFGLAKVALQPVIQLQPASKAIEKPNKNTLSRNLVLRVGVAAAVIATILLIFPQFDGKAPSTQNANMLSESGLFRNHVPTQPEAATFETSMTSSSEISNPAETVAGTPADEPVVVPSSDAKKYYVVMGVYEVREVAEQITQLLKDEGFTGTDWIERPGRIDVYAASFTDKTQAETFLKDVHSNYPNHADAWVLKR